jgi:hypothetical protein
MAKINKVKEGEMLFSVREDGERICQDCRYRKDCSERYRVEKMYNDGIIAKILACNSYEPEFNDGKRKFFGDLD